MAISYNSTQFSGGYGAPYNSPVGTLDQPVGFDALNRGVTGATQGITDYMMKQYAVTQGMQADLGKQMLSHKLDSILFPGQYAQMGFGPADAAKLDEMIGNNPYTRRMLTQLHSSLGNAGQPQGQPNQQEQGNPMVQPGQPQGGQPDTSGGSPTAGSVNPVMGVQPSGGQTSGGQAPGAYNMSAMGGSVPTENSRTFKTLFGDMSQKSANLGGEQAKAQATAQGSANVKPSEEFSTKIAGTQALAQENIARDDTQMSSVFQTLKNLHDIHSQLASNNLAGTHLGEWKMGALPFVGDIAATMGSKASDWQNKVMSPENQSLIGQFQAGRNEGITRAIQPMQNQVDKVGSSRIMDSMLDLLEGEYGKLDDPQSVFDGKTIGTARTLYRITLASQNYADNLKAQGIKLDGSDKSFNPDKIAKQIFNDSNSISFNPAQKSQFNQYANKIIGTQGYDYSTGAGTPPKGGSQNPVTNGRQKAQAPNISTFIAYAKAHNYSDQAIQEYLASKNGK